MFNSRVKDILRSVLRGDNARSAKVKRDSYRMLINKGLSVILSLFFLPLFLSCFNKVEYGIWITILSLINWIGFFDIGLGQGLRNKLTQAMVLKNYRLAREYISTTYAAVAFIFLTFIVAFLISYPFFDWYKFVNAPEYLSKQANGVLFVVVIATIFTFILRLLVFVLYGLQKPKLVSDIALVTQIITLLFVYIAIKWFYISSLVIFAVIVTAIPIVVYLGYSGWLYIYKYPMLFPHPGCVKKEHIRSLIGVGVFFFLIQLCNIVITQTNNVIIANVLGPEHVGEYQVVFQYMSVLTIVFYIVTTPYWSAVTEAYTRNDLRWIHNSVRELNFIYVGIVGVAVLMNVFSKLIFNVWIGDKIEVRYLLVFCMTVYVLLQAYGNIYLSIINGIGKIRLQFVVVFAAAILYIPLALYLTRLFGLYGLLIVMILMAIVTAFWASVQYKLLITGKARGIFNS